MKNDLSYSILVLPEQHVILKFCQNKNVLDLWLFVQKLIEQEFSSDQLLALTTGNKFFVKNPIIRKILGINYFYCEPIQNVDAVKHKIITSLCLKRTIKQKNPFYYIHCAPFVYNSNQIIFNSRFRYFSEILNKPLKISVYVKNVSNLLNSIINCSLNKLFFITNGSNIPYLSNYDYSNSNEKELIKALTFEEYKTEFFIKNLIDYIENQQASILILSPLSDLISAQIDKYNHDIDEFEFYGKTHFFNVHSDKYFNNECKSKSESEDKNNLRKIIKNYLHQDYSFESVTSQRVKHNIPAGNSFLKLFIKYLMQNNNLNCILFNIIKIQGDCLDLVIDDRFFFTSNNDMDDLSNCSCNNNKILVFPQTNSHKIYNVMSSKQKNLFIPKISLSENYQKYYQNVWYNNTIIRSKTTELYALILNAINEKRSCCWQICPKYCEIIHLLTFLLGCHTFWFQSHLYFDKNVGHSQRFIIKIFKLASIVDKAIIIIPSIKLFFEHDESSSSNHVQHGKSIFEWNVNQLRKKKDCKIQILFGYDSEVLKNIHFSNPTNY